MKKTKTIIKTVGIGTVALLLLVNLITCSDKKRNKIRKSKSSVDSTKIKAANKLYDNGVKRKTLISQELKEKYTKLAQNDFKLLTENKLDELNKQFDNKLKEEFNKLKLKEVNSFLEKGERFKRFGSTVIEVEKGIYVTDTILEYTNATFNLIIEFNSENGQISALYLQ